MGSGKEAFFSALDEDGCMKAINSALITFCMPEVEVDKETSVGTDSFSGAKYASAL